MGKILLLNIVIILGISEFLVINFLPFYYQWFFWNFTVLSMLLVVSTALFIGVRYNNFVEKFLSFSIILICFFGLTDFISRSFFEQNSNYFVIYNVLRFLFGAIIFLVFIRSYLKHFYSRSDIYDPKSSYIVYIYPKTFYGLIASIITSPYGHCFLVVKGKKFYFRRGVIIRTNFCPKDNLIFVKVRDVSLYEARKLVGVKWSLFKKCYVIFNKFK